jgi:hypothetical protein
MFVPQELCETFWGFVRSRAFEPDDHYHYSNALESEIVDRILRGLYIQPGDERQVPPNTFGEHSDYVPKPTVYATLQQALLDFLIDELGEGNGFTFADWLRAQALILAYVARDPSWLTVKTPVIRDDGTWDTEELTTHTMAISPGSWDALSGETFTALVREFYTPREGRPGPRRRSESSRSDA